MKVSILINPKAGTLKEDLIQKKISEALFRCDLSFHYTLVDGSMDVFIKNEISGKSDILVVCGGDGTINMTLQSVMKIKNQNLQMPPVCIIRSGTANDLAHEIGITERIDEAARVILEGKEKKIDVIEVTSEDSTKYMITNGGLGVPAETADKANQLRSFLQNLSADQNRSSFTQMLSRYSYGLVKGLGSFVYIAMLLETLRSWEQKDWHLDVELADGTSLTTIAPFILINNQPYLGKHFLTAPYTSNNDGLINLLLIESTTRLSQLIEVGKVYRGNLAESDIVKIFETSKIKLTSRNPKRKITFFGDGEILFREAEQISISCIPQCLTVLVRE